ncbi:MULTISPECIES: 3,4-dihydroxy-2-butanone-4-phosphate synthase [Pseudonocardia]|uniref:3,4-dihydroxy-2-butanone 4-phosphate synthase n=2 Tax=Pseudonocardia TaxID=1847 RepID=A0ABQ0S157_9PSEU|nr:MULTISPECIES: 3,4-dihydroxy-2-butanone-4-phosphate synthase [Pseudonocardia]BBG03752.1 hypothetical protein Pdca_49610 [Pseudonocardia autotrophica]GEC26640.1 hypothetical protein PSA01_36690 [Pseudonocardia saturnea]
MKSLDSISPADPPDIDPAEERVRAALAAIAAGEPVVVVDDADREDEGDLIFAAALATPSLVAFTVRHTSGFICVALPDDECDRLDLPPMHHRDGDRFRTAYRVTVDLAGTGTGISASSRAATIAALAAPSSVPRDFVRPGHVVPLRARPGGVLTRPGHTESAVDLARLAGLPPVGALCEIVSTERPGTMARGTELTRFAAEHGLALVSVDDIIRYRLRTEAQVERVVTTALPTEHGHFRAVGYRGTDGAEHVALIAGELDDITADTPVHVHVECLSGDVLRATSCACGRSLTEAMARFAAEGRGIITYLRPVGGVRACGLQSDPAVSGLSGQLPIVAEWILADLRSRSSAGVGTGAVRRLAG